jgi:hypothetical protein
MNRIFYRLSVRPGPETHTFSFQVSRNEGSVCLGTWGRAGQGRAGQGRAARAVIFIIEHIKKTRIFLKKKKENK